MGSVASVLIVDDDKQVFEALRRAMYREYHEMLFAPNADEALKLLARRPVDIIIADQTMPGMKGAELLAIVRRKWPETVPMMLTGDCGFETVVSAVNRGEIFRFFIKPANEAELIISIRDALKGRATRRQNELRVEAPQRQDETPVAEPPTIVLGNRPLGPTAA